LSWNTPIKEAELWNLVLRDFAVKSWYMWPVSGIRHNEAERVMLHVRHTFPDILADEGVKDLNRVIWKELDRPDLLLLSL
jgi:hypothetical protein